MATPPTPNPVFNPSDFVTSSGGDLTEAQANLKYMRLATESTATAIETFQAGIYTGMVSTNESGGTLQLGGGNTFVDIASPLKFSGSSGTSGQVLTSNGLNTAPTMQDVFGNSPSTAITILPHQTSGAITIAPLATAPLAIGSGNTVTLANIQVTGNSIDNKTNIYSGDMTYSYQCLSGNISLAASQTTGTLSIGNGTRSLAGVINLGCGSVTKDDCLQSAWGT